MIAKKLPSLNARIAICIVSVAVGLALGITSVNMGRACTDVCLCGGVIYLLQKSRS